MQAELAAREFVGRYERFWREGATGVAGLYTKDAILCGYEIVKGREAIANLLGAIVGQGWNAISIEIIEVTELSSSILLACRYVAKSAEQVMTAKSSYVLVPEEGTLKAAMHTAA